MMNVQVALFALARDRVGQPEIDVQLPDGATIRELKEALVVAAPKLSDVIPHCHFAVNQSYASDDTKLVSGAEVACIPPVSGG